MQKPIFLWRTTLFLGLFFLLVTVGCAKTDSKWGTSLIYPTMRFGIQPGKQTFEFNSYPQGIEEKGEVEAKVVIEDSEGKSVFETQVPIASHRYSFEADLPEGIYQVKMTLLPANLTSELKIRVVQPRETASVKVDGRGRFIVNGKPFLPVGIYSNMDWPEFKPWENKWRDYYTKTIIEDSPFNVLLPYDGLWWTLETPDVKSLEATQVMLDILQKNGKMIFLSVKDFHPNSINEKDGIVGALNITKNAVERFRDHPALLGWYVNDESDVGEYEREQAELVGMLDPYHPSLQVQFKWNLPETCLNGSDIYGLDFYPINGADSNQGAVRWLFQCHARAFGSSHGVPVCGVPQMFSWYAYDRNRPKYKPTMAQMRSTALMMAACGARSFIFYAHQGIVKMVEPFDISYEELWKEACELGQMMRDLEPYLLGDPLPITPTLEVRSGTPKVQVLTSNAGKQAVIISTEGDTKTTDIVIQLDANRNFRSKYGKTKSLGEGKYQFTCEYMDGDVLEEVAP